MKSLRFVLALIALCCTQLQSQSTTVIVHKYPLHVRHFAGWVVDLRGMTVEYATVELRDPKNDRVLASTFADGKGYFFFDDKKYGKQVEMRASQKGFNIAQYTVVRKPFGDVHVRIVLLAAN